MKRRIFICVLLMISLTVPADAAPIRWVDFDVPYESLHYAMEQDIASFEKEKHISWIDVLALAACRTGGKCGLSSVQTQRENGRRCLFLSGHQTEHA